MNLRVGAMRATDPCTKRCYTLCARYLKALVVAGEFDEPNYKRPGTYFEER